MPRFMLPLSALAALIAAFLLYGIKHDTRALEARVQSGERAIERAQSDIAALRAERAHLARPERIAPLARAFGLMPPAPDQLVQAGREVRGLATGTLAPSTGGGTR